MKKSILVLAAISAFALLFTGCPKSTGSNGNNPSEPQTVEESDPETGNGGTGEEKTDPVKEDEGETDEDTVYTWDMDGQAITITTKADGTFVAKSDFGDGEVVVGEGTYEIDGENLVATFTKLLEGTELEDTDEVAKFTADEDNVLTLVEGFEGSAEEERTWATETVVSNYSGTGFFTFINEDESVVAAGKEVEVVFDYKVVDGKWKSNDLNPKFSLVLTKDETSQWSVTAKSDTAYADGNSLSGTITKTLVAKDEVNQVKIQFNAFEWAGDTENDAIEVTVKSITVK